METQESTIGLFEGSDDRMLSEIVRQAELRLAEQGEVSRAGEQKAVQVTVLFGTLASLGFPIALQAWPAGLERLALAAGSASTLCFFAALVSVAACFPDKLGVAGNDPANWLEDLAQKKSLKRTMAETALHYDRAIKRNRIRMARRRFLLVASLVLFCFAAPAAIVGGVAELG